MADKSIQLNVKVNTETGALEVLGAKFQDTAKKAKEAQGAFQGLSSEAGGLIRSFLPFATAGGIAAFFTAAVKGAEEENEAIRRLKFGLEASGVSWKENEAAVMAWAAAIQSSTRFSDTEAFSSLDRLVRVTGNLAQAQSASQLAMGLSVQSGKSLSEAEGVLVDLLNGNERALKAVNREFGAFTGNATNTQQALDALQAKLGDAALKEESFTKNTAGLKNAFSELSEAVGRGLIPGLTIIIGIATKAVQMFDGLGTVLANVAAKAVAFSEAMTKAIFSVSRGGFKEAKEAFRQMGDQFQAIEDASVEMVRDSEAKKTATVSAEEAARLIAKKQRHDAEAEEAKKQADLFEEIDKDLDQKLAAIGEETFKKKQIMLEAEFSARRAKVEREVTIEANKAKLLSKLELEHVKRSEFLTKAEVKFKTDAAMKVLSDSVTALQILNSMQEGHTKEEARRAKILLAIQQAIAIANLWRAEAGKGVVGIALASAGTAVLVAQFAQQSKAIDQARSAANQGNSQLQISTPLPTGGQLNENFTGAGGAPGGTGGGAGVVSGGGGVGGGSVTVINVGGISVNFSAETFDLSEARTLLQRLADEVRRGTVEGIQFAVSVKNQGDKNAALAV